MGRKKNDAEIKRVGEALSEKIRNEIDRQGLSHGDLASLAGVSAEAIRSISINRIVTPNVFHAYKIVRALKGNLNSWMKEIVGDE